MPTNADPPALPVVAPHGDLDADTIGALTAELEAAVAEYGGVILDASGITFSDSSFLRLMLTTHQRVDLRIAAPSPVVARLFQLVCVEDVLRLFPTVQAARAGAPKP